MPFYKNKKIKKGKDRGSVDASLIGAARLLYSDRWGEITFLSWSSPPVLGVVLPQLQTYSIIILNG